MSNIVSIEGPMPRGLDSQSSLARAFGERLDAAVVAVAAAVEHGTLDAGRLGPLGQQRADLRRLLHRLQRPHVALGPLRGGHRAAGLVVDELGEDPAVRAADRQARARRGADHLRAHATAPAETLLLLGLDRHALLPTFRAT